jgi:FkbM family methyltransferase
MAINRKQLLRYTGAAAAGASLEVYIRGLLCPDRSTEGHSQPIPGRATGPAPPGSKPPPEYHLEGLESYSQSGEDLVVAFTLAYLGLGVSVTYLDVGANDPVKLNNTYYFYRQGKRGVLVEPNGEMCRRLREKRRQDTVLEAGIGFTAAREADYYIMTYDGLNTFSKEEAEHQVEASKGQVSIQRVIKMPLLNINDVMADHFRGAPTFLSIDTEGLDLAILKSIDYGRFRPRIICAETLISSTWKTRPEIAEFMTTQGYVARGGSFVNTIFVDSKLLG